MFKLSFLQSLTLATEKKNLEAKQKLRALNKGWTDTQSVQVALEEHCGLSVVTKALKTADYVHITAHFFASQTLFCSQAATDKTTENVHQTILETQQLTQWWENVVHQMKQQDTESQTCATVQKRGAHSSGTHTHTADTHRPLNTSFFIHPETCAAQADHQRKEFHHRRGSKPAGDSDQEQQGDRAEAEHEQAARFPAAAASEGAGEELQQAEGRGQVHKCEQVKWPSEAEGSVSALACRQTAARLHGTEPSPTWSPPSPTSPEWRKRWRETLGSEFASAPLGRSRCSLVHKLCWSPGWRTSPSTTPPWRSNWECWRWPPPARRTERLRWTTSSMRRNWRWG